MIHYSVVLNFGNKPGNNIDLLECSVLPTTSHSNKQRVFASCSTLNAHYTALLSKQWPNGL